MLGQETREWIGKYYVLYPEFLAWRLHVCLWRVWRYKSFCVGAFWIQRFQSNEGICLIQTTVVPILCSKQYLVKHNQKGIFFMWKKKCNLLVHFLFFSSSSPTDQRIISSKFPEACLFSRKRKGKRHQRILSKGGWPSLIHSQFDRIKVAVFIYRSKLLHNIR